MKNGLVLLMLLFLLSGSVAGQGSLPVDTVGIKVYFRRGYSTFESGYRDNGRRLESFVKHLQTLGQDTLRRMQRVHIIAGSSPEGEVKSNGRLSQKRASRVADYLGQSVGIPDSLFHITARGEDWAGLIKNCLLYTSPSPRDRG